MLSVEHGYEYPQQSRTCAGQSQSTMGQLDAVGGAGSSRVPGGASELEEEDPELSDVLKRSLEEH